MSEFKVSSPSPSTTPRSSIDIEVFGVGSTDGVESRVSKDINRAGGYGDSKELTKLEVFLKESNLKRSKDDLPLMSPLEGSVKKSELPVTSGPKIRPEESFLDMGFAVKGGLDLKHVDIFDVYLGGNVKKVGVSEELIPFTSGDEGGWPIYDPAFFGEVNEVRDFQEVDADGFPFYNPADYDDDAQMEVDKFDLDEVGSQFPDGLDRSTDKGKGPANK